jgi:muramidase (phage lysozyme)
MTDKFNVYRPLLDLIGLSEGTDRKRGYNETLGYGAYTGGDRNLVAMTLIQIEVLQTAMLAHPKNHLNSSAVGRYQIVRKTMREIIKALQLSGRELFDADMQDRMACYLLGKRGIDRWLAGKVSDDAMLNELAKEWASLPKTNGQGHYDGQRAAVTPTSVRNALAQMRVINKAGTPPGARNPGTKGGWLAALIAIFKAIFGGRK